MDVTNLFSVKVKYYAKKPFMPSSQLTNAFI